MKIFVCEFVTGGGLYREHLPPSLLKEANWMLKAVLDDLLALPGITVITTHDYRLTAPAQVRSLEVSLEDEVWAVWERCIQQTDAVWPIAPESDGILTCLCERVVANGKRLIASDVPTVKLASSKFETSRFLNALGIASVPTFTLEQAERLDQWPRIIKPDDGVSCEGTRIITDSRKWATWIDEQGESRNWIVQPFVPGIPASISMLCKEGRAWVLSCNRQLVDQGQDGFEYRGGIVNGMKHCWSAFEALAQQIAQAMPGLAGYIGVDLMVRDEDMVVMEVNPRLTTSYAGLARATGGNPGSLILDLFYNGAFPTPPSLERNIVELRLNEE